MSSLFSSLPAPKSAGLVPDEDALRAEATAQRAVRAQEQTQSRRQVPPYRKRASFVPRSAAEFGGGGAFPEIHVPQYPLGLGQRGASQRSGETRLSIGVDEDGKLDYGQLVKQGENKDRVVFSSYRDIVPKDATDQEQFEKPTAEEEAETAERTKNALETVLNRKILAGKPKALQDKGSVDSQPKFIRYTPSNQNASFNSGAQNRIIRMMEAPVDPLEPPKFKVKKVPGGPGSPPVPVMHSPPRKLTVEDQKKWKIPPCVSNWKNNKGYTIPLDKRLAADGRGLQEVQINDNFAKLSEALYIAERESRDEVKKRNEVMKRVAMKEKEKKEDELRALAAKARMERSAGLGLGTGASHSGGPAYMEDPEAPTRTAGQIPSDDDDSDGDAAADSGANGPQGALSAEEREALRRERKRERERERRMDRMGQDAKRTKVSRDRDRDISEKVALGLATRGASSGVEYDQRLFNQSAGMGSGFGADDEYNLYDKPLFTGGTSSQLYKHKSQDGDAYGSKEDLDKLRDTSKFQPDHGFKGAEGGKMREGAVEFEKEADPFGLDEFLSEAKRGK